MHRDNDYRDRSRHLAGLSEAELDARFWELANKIVAPLVELAQGHTSPSIERSVLLRMGFDSISAVNIVKRLDELGLLGYGGGHVLLKLAKDMSIELAEAGTAVLTDGGGARARALFFGGEVATQ